MNTKSDSENKVISFIKSSWLAIILVLLIGAVTVIAFILDHFLDTTYGLFLSIAIAPGIAIFAYVLYKDRKEMEPLNILALTFILGILVSVPVIFAEFYLHRLFVEIGLYQDVPATWFQRFLNALIEGVLIAAFVEETFKFLAVRAKAYNHEAFNEEMDGFVYAVSAALGFATLENVLYVISYGFLTGLVRAITSVPLHALAGAWMGYYLSQHKFHGKSILPVLVIPIFLHGFYDFAIFIVQGTSLWYIGLIVPFLTIIVAIVLFRPKLKELQEQSKRRRKQNNLI